MAKDNASGGGVGFFGLLAILFIGLKLAGIWGWFLFVVIIFVGFYLSSRF